MPLDIYSTYFMLAAVREIPLEHTFFKDRYFPTNQAMDIFATSRVLADYKQETRKAAPFVVPRIGSIPGSREGFSTADLEPGNISISMPLTLDQLTGRGFGESLMSGMSPEDRAAQYLVHDLEDLSNRISRTEEALAVQTILDNGAIMRHRTDREDVYEDVGVHFYDGANNPALFTPAATWANSTYANGKWTPGNWYADICAMIGMLTKKGRPAREIIVAPNVADFLMNDGWILAMLDNRRAEMGQLDPSALTEFVWQMGAFNFKGRRLPILVSDGTYEKNGVDTYRARLRTRTVRRSYPDGRRRRFSHLCRNPRSATHFHQASSGERDATFGASAVRPQPPESVGCGEKRTGFVRGRNHG